jgi:hypothetical protein
MVLVVFSQPSNETHCLGPPEHFLSISPFPANTAIECTMTMLRINACTPFGKAKLVLLYWDF